MYYKMEQTKFLEDANYHIYSAYILGYLDFVDWSREVFHCGLASSVKVKIIYIYIHMHTGNQCHTCFSHVLTKYFNSF